MTKTLKNGIVVDMTAEEQADYDERIATETAKIPQYKLEKIRSIRDSKLAKSDWKVTSAKEQGTNLSTSFKNWRQGLRDIPSTYTTESEYDELLARDENGNLTHSVWSE
tara:strand:- start:110 stop:436 length:327 start_codon:yes stop_codon:yes gene_type:complete